jgi:hypothetical protein
VKGVTMFGALGVAALMVAISGCGGGTRSVLPISDTSSNPHVSRGGQPPAVPTLYFPPDNSAYTTAGGYALFALRTTDPEGDRVQYQIEVYRNGTLVATFDQTKNASGWLNMQGLFSGQSQTSFASGEFAYLKTSNLPRLASTDQTPYQWRARAFDGTSWSDWTPLRSFFLR